MSTIETPVDHALEPPTLAVIVISVKVKSPLFRYSLFSLRLDVR